MRSGADIRQARQDAGLTLREVCWRACISPPFLSDLERGKRFATPDVLARIAAAVGLEPTAVGQQAAIDRLMESEAGRQVAQRLLAADARATAAEALLSEALDHLAAFAVLGQPTSLIRRFMEREDVRRSQDAARQHQDDC